MAVIEDGFGIMRLFTEGDIARFVEQSLAAPGYCYLFKHVNSDNPDKIVSTSLCTVMSLSTAQTHRGAFQSAFVCLTFAHHLSQIDSVPEALQDPKVAIGAMILSAVAVSISSRYRIPLESCVGLTG
jgi:hypothetical protein